MRWTFRVRSVDSILEHIPVTAKRYFWDTRSAANKVVKDEGDRIAPARLTPRPFGTHLGRLGPRRREMAQARVRKQGRLDQA